MTKSTNRCSVCKKQLGTSYCTGCGVYFCMRDFKGHRGILFNEMDIIVGDCNDLQNKIYKATQHNDSRGSLFMQIDAWQKATIDKVKQVAEQTRQQVTQLLNLKRAKISADFKRFSQELAQLKITENFVEHDIARLKMLVHQFNHELTQLYKPVTIHLHTEQSDRIVWNRLIYAEEKSTYGGIQQRQQQVKEEQQQPVTSSVQNQPPENYLFTMGSLNRLRP